jgi:uroporphyrin-3 C-methyltransferase
MNDTDKDEAQADATFDDIEAVEGTAKESKNRPKIEAPKKETTAKGGASTSIAWIALFLSLISAAGLGYLALEKFRSSGAAGENDKALADLRRETEDITQSVETVRNNLSGLAGNDTQTDAAIDSLRRDIQQREDLFNSLPPRMSSLERSVAALQGVSIEARNTYLIAEAEYYMQIANAQLQLAGNPYLASMALGQADDRLLQLADPALTDTRAAISDELAALEVMEKPDIAGATLILASLARVVDSLPLRSAAGDGSESASEGDEEMGSIDRAWAAVKDAASGLVKVTPPDGEKAALITPDIARLARSNLSLQLQAARLALLRGEQEIFEQSLNDADGWLALYFDTASEQVRSSRQTMAEIRTGYASVAPPDISQSLRLLRQYKTLAENTQ